jgi:hypothetical protein
MTIDPKVVGIGAAILAAVLIVYMPVNKRRVNQTLVALVIAFLIFVAAFSFLNAELALPVGAGVALVIIVARLVLGGLQSFVYRNFTRYTRRDFWQRRIGQSILGSGRRRRRND